MKKSIVIIIFLTQLKIVQGQNYFERVFLSTLDKKHLVYIELEGQHGTVFNFGKYLDKAGTGYSILFTDTIIKQADTSSFLFASAKTKIKRIENKLYLIAQVNPNKKIKRIKIDIISNANLVNTNINNAYWLDNFFGLCNSINSTFKLYHYSFRNGFAFWESFNNKGIYYKDFKSYADKKLKILNDSITAIQTPYVLLTNEVIKNIATIDYPSLKDSILKLPTEYQSQSGYFGTVINLVCNNRPELFFKLAEDMPDKKQMIFSVVNNKKVIKKLKAIETNSTVKKEFFKQKKRNKGFAIKAIATSVAGMVLLGYGIYVLVK